MEILKQLGINSTIIYQFVIFVFSYIAISQLIYGPYTKALLKRTDATKGSEDFAGTLLQQASELRANYEKKAIEINSEIKTVYDQYHKEAWKEYEEIVSRARKESHDLIEKARVQIQVEIADAAKSIGSEIPAITNSITTKLLGKS